MNRASKERIGHLGFALCAGLFVLLVAGIFFFIGSRSYQTFTASGVSFVDFFFGTRWLPEEGAVGAAKLIVGSFSVTLFAVLLSTPLSLGTALFITQIAPPFMQRLMQPVLELFTGLPSIIYGFLGLTLLVPFLRTIENAMVGGVFYTGIGFIPAVLVLAIMIMPTITSLSVDALRAVPPELKEGSLALGATRWQTIWRVLLPAARAGVLTGVILGVGRAIGETLAVAFVIGGNANQWPIRISDAYPYLGLNPTSTITVQLLFDFAEAVPRSLGYNAIWTLASVLLLISLLLVVASRLVASKRSYP